MRDDQHRFLSLLGQVPARLTAEQTAWLLNCQSHDVPVLVTAGLLKPLGNPQPNAVKYFAATEIIAVSKNPVWLSKLTVTLGLHWQKKNRRQGVRPKFSAPQQGGVSTRLPSLAGGHGLN